MLNGVTWLLKTSPVTCSKICGKNKQIGLNTGFKQSNQKWKEVTSCIVGRLGGAPVIFKQRNMYK